MIEGDRTQSGRLHEALRETGFSAACFSTPGAALAQANSAIYPLAFIELDQAENDGLDCAERLLGLGKVSDVVFMSRERSLDTALKALRLGAWDFLRKPLDAGDLRLLLERFQERRRLLRRIQGNERRHATLVQDLPALVFSLARDLELAFINQACEPVLGFSPREALTTPGFFLARVHPQDRRQVQAACVQAFDSHSPLSIECRLLHRQGRLIHGILRASPAPSVNGDGSRVEGVFMDITDRVYREKAVVQNEKCKTVGAISAEVAHEIRNPLMSIAGFARRLERKLPGTTEVGIILRESIRLEKLLKRIGDYLKPVGFSRRQCQPKAILADSLGLLHPEMTEKGVTCRLDASQDLPAALADPEMLTQVFVNLLRYALDTIDPGDSLPVTTAVEDRNLRVEIHCGVNPNLPRDPELLFLPFDEDGQNNGLPLTCRMLKNMGGLLHVTRENGKAVFAVVLPRADAMPCVESLIPDGERDDDRYCFDANQAVFSRDRFENMLERTIRLATRDGSDLSLILVDVDHFTEHTRHHGPEQAAENLQRITAALAASLPRAWQLLARYGQQEFAAILPDTGLDEARRLAEHMRRAVMDMRILCNGDPTSLLTVSLGIATGVPKGPNALQDMLAQASKALFIAKQQGRNCISHSDAHHDF